MVTAKKDAATGQAIGTGRRKTSVARVRIKPGSGKITVNGRELNEFFVNEADRRMLVDTLAIVNQTTSLDIAVKVTGGGTTGQAGACRMGMARALISYDTAFFEPLRDGGYLTRDSRMKERKKFGLRGARRGVQFSKR